MLKWYDKATMEAAIEIRNGIFEFKEPQECDAGQWLEQHLDCDAIVDDKGKRILVYAFTVNPAYNGDLADYRQEKYADQFVLRGISSDGLNSIF